MSDERSPYVDPKLSTRLVPLVRQTLGTTLPADEDLLGLFSVFRFRRGVTVLVVTDRRLLTLGEEHVGMPLVDEVSRSDVREVRIERDKVFRAGQVTARTTYGELNLGTLNYTPTTFIRLEEVLARKSDRSLPRIPVPGSGPPLGLETVEDEPGPVDTWATSTHPLVAHLTALAELHERGALTDAEFSAAKARLLAEREG